MFTIENNRLSATFLAKGAELVSLFHKDYQLQYMWDGNPDFWGKHSPVLFPVVGTLKDDTYFYKDQPYHLSRHGFARDKPFVIEDHTADIITFVLYSNDDTKKNYPFEFEFRIKYSLYESSLATVYEILNTGDEQMLFSVGAHPAFRVPLADGTQYHDYYLEFDKPETAPRWPISARGLIEAAPVPLLENNQTLPLTKTLFQKDALVFKNLSSTIVSLKSSKTPHGLQFDFPGFPYLGLWAAKNADFVCIEPWCGIADSVNSNRQLDQKEGINKLAPGETFTRTWTVALF